MQVANGFVLVPRASRANLHQQLRHGDLRNASHAEDGADAAALIRVEDHLSAAGGIRVAHADRYA